MSGITTGSEKIKFLHSVIVEQQVEIASIKEGVIGSLKTSTECVDKIMNVYDKLDKIYDNLNRIMDRVEALEEK